LFIICFAGMGPRKSNASKKLRNQETKECS